MKFKKLFKKLLSWKGRRDHSKVPIQETDSAEVIFAVTGKTSSVYNKEISKCPAVEATGVSYPINKPVTVVAVDVEKEAHCTDAVAADLDVKKEDFDTNAQCVSHETDSADKLQDILKLQSKALQKSKDHKSYVTGVHVNAHFSDDLVCEKAIVFPDSNLAREYCFFEQLKNIQVLLLSLDHKVTSIGKSTQAVLGKTEESDYLSVARNVGFYEVTHEAVLSDTSDKSLNKDFDFDDADSVNINEILDTSDAFSQEVNTADHLSDLSGGETNTDDRTLRKQILQNDETDDVESIEDTENSTSSGYPLDTLDLGTSSCEFGVDIVSDSDDFDNEHDESFRRTENICHGDNQESDASSLEVPVDGDKNAMCTINDRANRLCHSDNESSVTENENVNGVSTTDNTFSLDDLKPINRSDESDSDSGLLSDSDDSDCTEKTEILREVEKFNKEENVDKVSKSDENSAVNDVNLVRETDALGNDFFNERLFSGVVGNKLPEIDMENKIDDNEEIANDSDKKGALEADFSIDEHATSSQLKAHEANEALNKKYVPSDIDCTEFCKVLDTYLNMTEIVINSPCEPNIEDQINRSSSGKTDVVASENAPRCAQDTRKMEEVNSLTTLLDILYQRQLKASVQMPVIPVSVSKTDTVYRVDTKDIFKKDADVQKDREDDALKKKADFFIEGSEDMDSGIGSIEDLVVDRGSPSDLNDKKRKSSDLMEVGNIMNKKRRESLDSTRRYDNLGNTENTENEEEKKDFHRKGGQYDVMVAEIVTDGVDNAVCKGTENNTEYRNHGACNQTESDATNAHRAASPISPDIDHVAKHTCSDALDVTVAPAFCSVEAGEIPDTNFGNTRIVMKEEDKEEVEEPRMDKHEVDSRKEGSGTVQNGHTSDGVTPEDNKHFGRTIAVFPTRTARGVTSSLDCQAALRYKKKDNTKRESYCHSLAGKHRGKNRKTPMSNQKQTTPPNRNKKRNNNRNCNRRNSFNNSDFVSDLNNKVTMPSKLKPQRLRNGKKIGVKEATSLPQFCPIRRLMKKEDRLTSIRSPRGEFKDNGRGTPESNPAPEMAIGNINEPLELLQFQQDSGYLSEIIDSLISSLESVIKSVHSSTAADKLKLKKQKKYGKKLHDKEVNIQHRLERLLSHWTYFRPYVASLDVAPGLEDYFKSLDNGQTPSVQEQMNIEWLRLRSFSTYQGNGSSLNLARNGFYHDFSQGRTTTRCVACNVQHSEWEYFTDVPEEHRRLSPNCAFVSDQETHQDNVSIPSEASRAQAQNASRDATRTQGTVAQKEEAKTSPTNEVSGAYAQPQDLPSVTSSAKPFSSASASSSGAVVSVIQSADVDNTSMAQKGTDINSSVQISHEAVSHSQSMQPTEDAENQSLPRSSIFHSSPRLTGNIRASALRAGSHTHGPTLDQGGPGSPTGNQAATNRANDVPPILSEAGITELASKLGEEWAILILCLQVPFETMQRMMAEHGTTEAALPATIKACLESWRDTNTGNDQDKVDRLLNALNETGRTELVTFVRQYNQGYTGPTGGRTRYGATGGASRPTVTVQGSNDPRSVTVSNPKYPQYNSVDVRTSSFRGWPTALDLVPRQMAEAGFFYAGVADFTRCFACGGGLRNWESGDDPCMEHTRWFSHCEYMKKLKGEVYVNNVKLRQEEHLAEKQRQREEQERRNAARRNLPVPVETDAGKTLITMGYTTEHITRVIEALRTQTGNVTVSAEQAIRYILEEDERGTVPTIGSIDARRNVGAPQIGRPNTPRNDVAASSGNIAGNASASQSSATPPPVSVVPSRPLGRVQAPSELSKSSESMASLRTATSSPSNSASHSPSRQKSSQEAATGKTTKKKKNKKKGKGEDSKESSASGSTNEPTKLDPKSLLEENERLRDMQKCKVCMDNFVDTTLLPCGHLILCSTCAPKVDDCPVCRVKIQGSVRTYLS